LHTTVGEYRPIKRKIVLILQDSMRKVVFFILLTFGGLFKANAQDKVLVLDGTFMGKNLYVQNTSTVGFCVTSVEVNGNVTTDETNSSAFEIDFKPWQLRLGDKVEVRIHYKNDCKPNVLNPEVLKPRSTYTLVSITATEDGTVKWSTTNEMGKLTYQVEQLRWKKWVKVGEVEGKGTPATNDYVFKTKPHSGINVYRVQQTDYTGKPNASPAAECNSHLPVVVFKLEREEIRFFVRNKETVAETLYELYDQYGQLLKQGYGASVDISDLPKGSYYLNYDNKTEAFKKT